MHQYHNVHSHIHTHTHTHIYMYVCMSVCVCVCVCIQIYLYTMHYTIFFYLNVPCCIFLFEKKISWASYECVGAEYHVSFFYISSLVISWASVIYIYIYIYRERERESVCVFVCMRERERERERETCLYTPIHTHKFIWSLYAFLLINFFWDLCISLFHTHTRTHTHTHTHTRGEFDWYSG